MKFILSILVLGATFLAQGAPVASGKLVLSKTLNEKAKGIRTVYITVIDPASPAPMPCAAEKVEIQKDASGEFASFALDTDRLMLMACAAIPDTFNLKAKLDKDGSAGRDAPGDIVGTLSNIKKGAKNLKLSLEKSIE